MSETLAEKVVGFIDEATRQAVEAERGRAISLCKQLERVYARQGERDMSRGCRRCAQALEEGAEPSPLTEEPMTVEQAMAKCLTSFGWDDIQADLTVLVKAQARRDANLVQQLLKDKHLSSINAVRRALEYQEAILKSAGLE